MDIALTIDPTGELMVFGVRGLTEVGVDFIDAWIPRKPATPFFVVDAGHLVIHNVELNSFKVRARRAGLKMVSDWEYLEYQGGK
jgi:hypothetical protein